MNKKLVSMLVLALAVTLAVSSIANVHAQLWMKGWTYNNSSANSWNFRCLTQANGWNVPRSGNIGGVLQGIIIAGASPTLVEISISAWSNGQVLVQAAYMDSGNYYIIQPLISVQLNTFYTLGWYWAGAVPEKPYAVFWLILQTADGQTIQTWQTPLRANTIYNVRMFGESTTTDESAWSGVFNGFCFLAPFIVGYGPVPNSWWSRFTYGTPPAYFNWFEFQQPNGSWTYEIAHSRW